MLEELRKVAELDAKIFDLESKLKEIPRLVKQKEEKLNSAKKELTEKETEMKSLKLKADMKEKELQDAEQATIKIRAQINQAKTNKEYQALQNEILTKEADNARIETAVLEQMQKLDKFREELAKVKAAIAGTETAINAEKKLLLEEEAELKGQNEKLQAERTEAAKAVAPDIFAKYQRLITRRGQTAMVSVRNNACQGCFMTMRPETLAQLRKGTDLVTCHSCGRILYIEE